MAQDFRDINDRLGVEEQLEIYKRHSVSGAVARLHAGPRDRGDRHPCAKFGARGPASGRAVCRNHQPPSSAEALGKPMTQLESDQPLSQIACSGLA